MAEFYTNCGIFSRWKSWPLFDQTNAISDEGLSQKSKRLSKSWQPHRASHVNLPVPNDLGGATAVSVRRKEWEENMRRRSYSHSSSTNSTAVLERSDVGTGEMGRAYHGPAVNPHPSGDSLGHYRLDQLTISERSSLERDLELAAEVQQQLLPNAHLCFDGWELSYRYKALGPVGGDYCDTVIREAGEKELWLALGDASGKGIAASLLMVRLHAVFHSLSLTNLPIGELVEGANRVLCQHTANSSFATLVCVRANSAGDVEICNAGHCPPLLVGEAGITQIDSGGFPLGLFPAGQYSVTRLHLARGESLFLYTDGLTEARDRKGDEYGDERLRQKILQSHSLSPQALIETCMEHLAVFLEGMPLTDDLTVMALRHVN
jgi:hypothetical protein